MLGMRAIFLGICVGLCGTAFGQASDLVMMANPEPNTDRLILRQSTAIFGDSDDRTTGGDFDFYEQDMSLRYGAILNEKRELYLALDAYYANTNNRAFLAESMAPIPRDLYDFAIGGMYRQTIREDWRIGGTLRVGSASDKPFNSIDEMYARGIGFLQVPHLEYTAWVFFLGLNTDWELPVVPGIGYQFPVSRRAIAIVGIPVMGAGGQLTDRIGFNVVYWPIRNLQANINFQVTEWARPYLGYRWRGRYFSRADRPDDDDRLLLEDMRAFVGTVFQLTERWTLDVQGGYVFNRQIGEGDDLSDRDDNNVHIDDTLYGQVGFGFTF